LGFGAEGRDYRDGKSRDKGICACRSGKVYHYSISPQYLRSHSNNPSYRLVSVARGEQDFFSPEGIPTAVEGCKSTALRRCCKDLGVASELWDPRYIRKFMAEHVKEIFVEHAVTKKRKKMYLRKDDVVRYPFKETKYGQ